MTPTEIDQVNTQNSMHLLPSVYDDPTLARPKALLEQPQPHTCDIIHEVVAQYNAAMFPHNDQPQSGKTLNKESRQVQDPSVLREEEPAIERVLRIPDMFVNFCAVPPPINQCYDSIKKDSESFIRAVSGFDTKESKKHIKADFPYLGAILVPNAGPNEFRNVCDWLNWVFDFDDLFDEGKLKEDPDAAKEAVDRLLATMDTVQLDQSEMTEDVLIELFRSVWLRLAVTSAKGTQQRFKESMTDYCNGLIEQTEAEVDPNNFDLEDYLRRKCQTVATYPLYAMVEYCCGLDLSSDHLECASIKSIQRLSTELTVLQNDVMSYHKEKDLGFEHNLIGILIRQGKTEQEAYDCLDSLMQECYHEWYIALVELPVLGEDIDRQIQLYIQGCQNMVIANLNWSFKTERYFGKDHWRVRRTRALSAAAHL